MGKVWRVNLFSDTDFQQMGTDNIFCASTLGVFLSFKNDPQLMSR